jgi:hypothetical protein
VLLSTIKALLTVYQDRSVKEPRLGGISDIEAANHYLETEFLQEINGEYEKLPAEPHDAHVPLLANQDLRNVLSDEQQRVVSQDFVVQFAERCYQILSEPRRHRPRPNPKVAVRTWLDETVHFFWLQATARSTGSTSTARL